MDPLIRVGVADIATAVVVGVLLFGAFCRPISTEERLGGRFMACARDMRVFTPAVECACDTGDPAIGLITCSRDDEGIHLRAQVDIGDDDRVEFCATYKPSDAESRPDRPRPCELARLDSGRIVDGSSTVR